MIFELVFAEYSELFSDTEMKFAINRKRKVIGLQNDNDNYVTRVWWAFQSYPLCRIMVQVVRHVDTTTAKIAQAITA